MKDAVIANIVSAFSRGKLSKNMIEFKRLVEQKVGKVLNASEFAEYLYDNEILKHKEAVAGDEELAHVFAYFDQDALGGNTGDDTDPFWLKVWDADTRLNYGGKPVQLNELANYHNLNQWKVDIPGHLKHNSNNVEELNNTDAKFDFENGSLFLKMNPTDKNVHKGLREGIIKPSIEVAFPEYMYDADNEIIKSYVKVNGLGLMADGKQMGLNVGPANPNKMALGGKNMADGDNKDEPTEADKFQTELKSQMDKEPEKVYEQREDHLKKIETFKITGDFKKDFDTFLEKNKPQVDDVDLSESDKFEAKLKEVLDKHKKEMEDVKTLLEENSQKSKQKDDVLAKLQQNLITIELENAKKEGFATKTILVREDMTLDEIQARVSEIRAIREALFEGVPEEDVPPFIKKVTKPNKDKDGNLSDDYYKTLDEGLTKEVNKKFSSPLEGYNPHKSN